MDRGTKIAEGTLKELLAKYKDTLIYTIYADNFPAQVPYLFFLFFLQS